jgi:hypothetical protein
VETHKCQDACDLIKRRNGARLAATDQHDVTFGSACSGDVDAQQRWGKGMGSRKRKSKNKATNTTKVIKVIES